MMHKPPVEVVGSFQSLADWVFDDRPTSQPDGTVSPSSDPKLDLKDSPSGSPSARSHKSDALDVESTPLHRLLPDGVDDGDDGDELPDELPDAADGAQLDGRVSILECCVADLDALPEDVTDALARALLPNPNPSPADSLCAVTLRLRPASHTWPLAAHAAREERRTSGGKVGPTVGSKGGAAAHSSRSPSPGAASARTPLLLASPEAASPAQSPTQSPSQSPTVEDEELRSCVLDLQKVLRRRGGGGGRGMTEERRACMRWVIRCLKLSEAAIGAMGADEKEFVRAVRTGSKRKRQMAQMMSQQEPPKRAGAAPHAPAPGASRAATS